MNENGNIKNIGDFFSRITDNRNWQVMLIVIGLSPIIESASGFGVSLMVITPILIILGLSRFRAVIVSLISLLAIPWGALATGMIIGAGLVDMDPKIMGTWSAILSVPIFLFLFERKIPKNITYAAIQAINAPLPVEIPICYIFVRLSFSSCKK